MVDQEDDSIEAEPEDEAAAQTSSLEDEDFLENYFGLVGLLVEEGGGAWVGMTALDHAEWAKSCLHPSENLEARENLPDVFMEFEAENSCEEVDLFRAEVLEEYMDFVENTKEERAQMRG